MKVTARDIARNPDYYLYRLDIEKSEVQLLEVTPDAYVVSAFLDNRIVLTRERLHGFTIDAIISAMQQVGASPARVHYLFHSAFCCSSLLARSFQIPKIAMVLREPIVLRQLCDLKRPMILNGNDWLAQGHALLDLAITLLSKTYFDSEAVLIKPTNLANNMIAEMLALRPDAKAIFLYSDLKDFLISNLKKTDETQQKMRTLARMFARDISYLRHFPDLDIDSLNWLQAVFIVWHAQMLNFSNFLKLSDNQKIASLNSSTLLAKPRETMAAVSGFYGFGLDAEKIREIVSGPTWKTHAKDPLAPYDQEERERENAAIASRYRTEIEEVLRWADPFLARVPVATPLHHALIN